MLISLANTIVGVTRRLRTFCTRAMQTSSRRQAAPPAWMEALEPRVMLAGDMVGVRALDNTAAERSGNSNPGIFVIERSGVPITDDLEVHFTVLGSAATEDYNALSGVVRIPARARSVRVAITPTDDAVVEDAETVILQLVANDNYDVNPEQSRAIVTISDNEPTLRVTTGRTNTPEATPNARAGTFVISRANSDNGSPIAVQYTVAGDATPGGDYLALSGEVVIPAGRSSVTINVVALDDSLVESDETVVLTLTGSPAYRLGAPRDATVVIADNEPFVSMAKKKDANEGRTAPVVGSMVITRRGGGVGTALTVNYSIDDASTAAGGEDYAALSGSVIIPANSKSVTINVAPVQDTLAESTEFVRLRIASSDSYRLNPDGSGVSATVIITNAIAPAALASSQDSIKYLASVMDQFSHTIPVYTDLSSAGNRFHALAKIPNADAPVEMSGAWTSNPHSGATAFRASFTPTSPSQFGGYYLLNGVLPDGATAPVVNLGTFPDSGIDLTGATELTFWARGERGRERIDFLAGGVGRDSVTGQATTPFPESFARRPVSGNVVTLTTSWRKYKINLREADLSYVLAGLGWVASATENPNGAVFFLDDIHFELDRNARDARLNQPRFLVSYTTLPLQPDPFDSNTHDDIDLTLRNTAFSYDNALALLAFLADGRPDSLRRASLIGDAFLYAVNHDRFFNDGRVRTAYAGGDIALPPGWTPNGRTGTVPVPGFYSDTNRQFYEVEQTAIDTGNNAWTMTALLGLYRQTGTAAYLTAAERIGRFILSLRNDAGTYQGFFGGIDNPESDAPAMRQYASAEHALDINAAFTVMFQVTGDTVWRDGANHARQFIESMWDSSVGLYRAGTLDPNTRNEILLQIPLDVQAWSVLSNAATLGAHPDLLATVAATFGVSADGYTGVDFNTDRDGVWFEGTAQMALARAIAGQPNEANLLREQLRTAQRNLVGDNRTGVAAASHDRLSTGFNFAYFTRLHVGATAWNVFAQLGYNPYYSGQRPPALVTTTPPGVDPPPPGVAELRFNPLPAYGSSENLSGTVFHVDPSQYRLAVFTKVAGGWWNKPYWNQPTVPIGSNGTWSADITTAGWDQFASDIAVFVVPATYQVPLLQDAADLPESLSRTAILQHSVHRSAPIIQGAGVPSLSVTNVPAIRSTDNLRGIVQHVNPVEYMVAVYIKVFGGWWNKPTWAHPSVPIGADGAWEADVTTGGSDTLATDFVVLLVPAAFQPLRLSGGQLPAGFDSQALVRVDIQR